MSDRTGPRVALSRPTPERYDSEASEGDQVGNATAAAYRVSVIVEDSQRRRISQRWVRELVRSVLAVQDVPPRSRVEVLLAGDDAIQRLNAAHLSVDSTTDVLSFPSSDGSPDGDGGFLGFPGGWTDIGQIALSLPQAERQARERGHALQDEAAHLIVHGALHLLGYDHQAPAEAAMMRRLEESLLTEVAGVAANHVHAEADESVQTGFRR